MNEVDASALGCWQALNVRPQGGIINWSATLGQVINTGERKSGQAKAGMADAHFVEHREMLLVSL